MSKLCTVCHKKEVAYENFGGVCNECFFVKEAEQNRIEHDKQVIKDYLEFQTDIDGVPFPEPIIDIMVNTYFNERQVDYSE